MKIKYENLKLRGVALDIIAKAILIVEEYAAQGFSLTLRQLYYQFVSRDLFPSKWIDAKTGSTNNQKSYHNLGVIISNARRAGLIDWNAIVDHTRSLHKSPTWDSPMDIIMSAAQSFRLDLWAMQARYVELWFEKDALMNVMQRAALDYRIPYFSCRGYASDSSLWAAAQRLQVFESNGKETIILHFGDHDPSGLDMTRDIETRLNLFGAQPTIKRLALNLDQVKKYNPPPNPAKETDSRFDEYRRQFGLKSWELDALNPDILCKLVAKEAAKHVDLSLWDLDKAKEDEARIELNLIHNFYPKAVKAVQPRKKKTK